MRKLISFLAVVAVLSSFYSCKKQCEKDKTGEITVTNSSGEDLWFDVTDATGATTENRQVLAGSSTTYTMPEGTVKIWGSHVNNTDDFFLIQTATLNQCAEDNFTVQSLCTVFPNTTHVKVINNYSFPIIVDVWITGGTGFLGEKTLTTGTNYIYSNAPSTTAEFWAKPVGGTSWTYSNEYNINSCQMFTFTWTPAKMDELTKGDKRPDVSVIERDVKK
jgi:hypothetical protein